MRILVDCDVVMDVATGRMPFAVDSVAVLDWCERHPGSGFVAWHTAANLHYLMRKDDAAARQFIQDLVAFVEVVPAGTAEMKHALALQMSDFEDALQAAAAVHAGVDHIVTRNVADYGSSPVPAILPADFLAQAPL